MTSVDLLTDAYQPLLSFAAQVTEPQGWTPSLLPGWTVRDLLLHLAADCQRALVALATPSAEEVDTDEISYWSQWKPGTEGAQAALRGTRWRVPAVDALLRTLAVEAAIHHLDLEPAADRFPLFG